MKRFSFLAPLTLTALSLLPFGTVSAHDLESDSIKTEAAPKQRRLSIGGYGEVAMTRNFYSDSYLRYTTPEKYRNQQH